MITDDQVVDLFAEANPIPTMDALNAGSVVEEGTQESTPEGSRRMVIVESEQSEQRRKRGRPILIGALGVALAAAIALPLFLTDDQSDMVTSAGAEEEAVQVALDFFAALTTGDVEAAMALMAPELAEPEFNRPAIEFFAALPGTKTLSGCTTTEGPSAVGVSCQTNFSGPLMEVFGPKESTTTLSVQNGLLKTFIPGSREEAAEAFAEYASRTLPEQYRQACSPESYEVASVRTEKDSGFAFAGPCGELWARVAEDAATWVEAGRPSIPQDN